MYESLTYADEEGASVLAVYLDRRRRLIEDAETIATLVNGGFEIAAYASPEPVDPLLEARETMSATRYAIKAAAFDADILGDITTAVEAVGGKTALAWSDAPGFTRLSPVWAEIASAAGLSDEQQDALFGGIAN